MRWFWLSAVVVCLIAAVALAQTATKTDPPADDIPTLKVDVNIGNIFFSVRDKRGGLVGNLEKGDFTIFEDGKEQTASYFTRESNLPLTIGLLVDVSKSMESLIEVEKRAAEQFFLKVLREKDMAFIISFGPECELMQDYTNSQKLLRAALGELKIQGGMYNPLGTPGPVPVSRPKGTVLYDAVSLASTEKLRGEVGRKAVIIISDGVDQGSTYTLRQAIEAAQKADAIIYSILYEDPQYTFVGGSGEGELKKMSEETGGRLYRIGRKQSLDDIFTQIQEEMRSQYSIAYTPTNPVRDGGFRKIEIKPKNKELKVQARKGYYATPAGATN